MGLEELKKQFNITNESELYTNSEVLKYLLNNNDYSLINNFLLKAWDETNIRLFANQYKVKRIYYVPDTLLTNSLLLSIFISENLDCYEFVDKAWTDQNIDNYFQMSDYLYIPEGLQSNNYALKKIIELGKYELAVFFKNNAWTDDEIINYFNNVSPEDINISDNMLSNPLVIKLIIKKGYIKSFIYELQNHKLTQEEAQLYISYLKSNNESTIVFPKSELLLHMIIKEKLYSYYPLFCESAWNEECITEVINDSQFITTSIPTILKDKPLLLKQLLLNNTDYDYNVFFQDAWNEENIVLFENILLTSNYIYGLPNALKCSVILLKFFIENNMTNYFDSFFNGAWTPDNIRLFTQKYIEENNETSIPFFLNNNEELLKLVLLYNRKEYYDSFTDDAWTPNNISLLKIKINKGLTKEELPSILKKSYSFLNFVLSHQLRDYYDYFDEIIKIDKEADIYFKLFTNNQSIGLPKWFISSSRGLQLFLSNETYYKYLPLFNPPAWTEDNTKLYINTLNSKDKITLCDAIYHSKKSLFVLLNYKEYIPYLSSFDVSLWDEKTIQLLINQISDNQNITNTLNRLYNELNTINLKKELLKYVLENYDCLDETKLNHFAEIIINIANSNSSEIYHLKTELVPLLLNSPTPIKDFKVIEEIFLSNHLPAIAKRYYVYQIFHKEGIDLSRFTISPVLKKHKQYQDYIILSDLLKIAINSNNTSLRNYLIRLQQGHRLLKVVLADNKKLDNLTYEEHSVINDYVNNIYLLYNSSRLSKNEKYNMTDNLLENVDNLLALLKIDFDSLLDRIIRMYFGLIGINTYEELVKIITELPEKATLKGINTTRQGLLIQKGDFIKGINDVKYLANILDNGSLASEYLGASAKKGGDCTPLDTDCSIVLDNDLPYRIFNNPYIEANKYGKTWLVLKNDNRFTTTRNENNQQEAADATYDKEKMEVFSTLGSGCYGIRTGFGSSEIDYIVTSEYSDSMAFTITKNGFYIPVYDLYGKLLFTKDDYFKIKSQMDGLTHYGEYNYTFSNNLDFPEILSVIKDIPLIEQETISKKNSIKERISQALIPYGLEMKDNFDGDLSRNKYFFIDIGSTGRKTNLKNDSDFDFLLILDKSIINDENKMTMITNALRKSLNKTKLEYEDRIANGYDFRFSDVMLPDTPPLKIDITFVEKNDQITYSSDMCIKDRFNTMNIVSKTNTTKAIANIMFAKQLLKSNNAYKSRLSSTPEGGMSAVGIETWILSHGGSFIDAALDFINAYNEAERICESRGDYHKRTIWDNFKKIYKVWNFGENYYSLRKDFIPLHGEFISNDMTEEGFIKMVKCLKTYLINNNLLNENQQKKD